MDIKSILSEFGTALLADVFSIKMLTKLLAKGASRQEGSAATATTASTATAPGTDEIKFGGIFDLSEETAYLSLMAKMESDPQLKNAAIKISSFVNGNNFQNHGQRRRFRVVVGKLANIEYIKEDLVTEKQIPNPKGGKPVIEKTTKQTKSNLGLEFLKSFSRLSEEEMLEICKASGIMESTMDNIGEGLSHAGEEISKIAKKIESSQIAQDIMAGSAKKMRERIQTLEESPYPPTEGECEEKKMTISVFLTLTFEWLSAEYKTGDLNDALEKVKNIINITKQKAQQWWIWAKRLAIWGTIISFVIFLAGIFIGGFTQLGWPNSVVGLLIAPILFAILVWWTPLVAIIAVIYEITHLRIKGATNVGITQAKWWLNFVCGVLLWQVIISLAFTFIPYWNAISRIPVMILLALGMALMSLRWGGITWYRSIIKTLVALMFILQVTVCFLPATATAIHSLLGKTDSLIATWLTTGAWIDNSNDREIKKMSGGLWIVSFKNADPIELDIPLNSRFLISASEAINLQWPVMGNPGEFCTVPLNTEITNKIFAKVTLKGEAGKTITVKLL
ncbi:MAG: hypothetical protein WCV70_01230 [Patescibacteria group bacterium]|jgi:hypothetical protein